MDENQSSNKNLFCGFRGSNGYCGTFTNGQERCPKHKGLKIVVKEKAKKFGGDSSWRKSEGYFDSK